LKREVAFQPERLVGFLLEEIIAPPIGASFAIFETPQFRRHKSQLLVGSTPVFPNGDKKMVEKV